MHTWFKPRGLVILGFLLACLPALAGATPWTPVAWKENGKLRNWVRDTNNNFVDDLIESHSGQVTAIVDLNDCVGDPETSAFIAYLNTLGDVTYVGKYLSFVVVTGIEPEEALLIGGRPEVAMVELALEGKWLWDVYQAAKVRSSGTYANNLEDDFGWSGTLDGSGINIAILDTGVSPGYDAHFQHGYNALTDSVENPPAAVEACGDHAGEMASLIFDPTHGMARGAGLIDIKMGEERVTDGTMRCVADGDAFLRALEKIYEMRESWQINVVSMSGSFNEPADGSESYNQYVDMLSGMGVVFLAGAGDNSPDAGVGTPAAATRAIAVSTADINNTVLRDNDTATLVRGPRADDGDSDPFDELKPEVVFPMGGSLWLNSISTATAATAGLVALALQHHPQLADFDNQASGSVKDLLIRSAEYKGTAYTSEAYPHTDPTWDRYFGYGEIDAYAAFSHLGPQNGTTDLTFLGFDGSAHPSTPWYHSLAVETDSQRNGDNIQSGVGDTIYARVHNNGTNPANRVKVSFGFYPFTAGIPAFYDIGAKVIDLPGGATQEVFMDWTPPFLQDGEDHGCILVTIDYGYDTDFSNRSNSAQKNVRVHNTSSPAVFDFRVMNTLPGKALIRLKVENQVDGWDIILSEIQFVMEAHACARQLKATVTPTVKHPRGTEALFFVTAYAAPWGTEDFSEIGGVALKARFEGAAFPFWTVWTTVIAVLLCLGYWLGMRRRRRNGTS